MASSAQQNAAVASVASRSHAGTSAAESRKVSFQQPSGSAPSRSSSAAHLSSSSSSTSRAAGGASSNSQAYSAYSGVTRRHSLFGTEDRVVLDIGSRYSKFGFSGEPRPRAIVPSVSFSQPSTSYLRLDASSPLLGSHAAGETLWNLDFERCADDQLRRGKRALLLAQLTQLLRNAFTQHLMVDPKQRKVLVVENPMLPNTVKEMILKVLFNNLQVPSISFVPAPLLSLVAVGRITGLVLEVGFLESTLTPVYYGRPLESHTVSSARAGERLNARLKLLLLRYGKFVAAQNSLQDCAKSLRDRTRPIDPATLTDDRIEQIKAKALFVSSNDATLSGLEDSFADLELESVDSHSTSTRDRNRSAAEIRQRYSSTSTATPFTFAVAPDSVDPQGTASLIQSVTAPVAMSASSFGPAASGKAQASGVIAIPGWVRERAAELLFETGDEDDSGLAEMTVIAISKLPIDLRRIMCENILVSGGTAMLPGFANRFRTQLAKAVEEAERSGGRLSIDRHVRRPKVNAKSEETDKVKGTSLHGSVAVLNDPWPESSSSTSGGKKSEGGSAPAFAANLLPWMGASLAGALKTTALNAVTREAYDEANRSTQDGAEEESKAETDTAEKDEKKGPEKEKRPAMPMASKRGSFVGVVGGLETGAYGGLAAVSRHLVGVPGSSPVKGSAAARMAPDADGNEAE